MSDDQALWPEAMSETDREAYRRSGFGSSVGFGARPAVLVIDVQYRTVGPRKPVLEAIRDSYPTACGEPAWSAIDRIAPLLSTARACGVPVLYPCVAPKTAANLGAFGRINPLVGGVDERGYEFVEEVGPVAGELIVPKPAASSFHGTPLAAYLIDRSIDTLLLTGCTTSGCVRATAVDAFSLNFNTIVVSDAVYDRATLSHQVSLFELGAKYADVLPSAQVIDRLRTRHSDVGP